MLKSYNLLIAILPLIQELLELGEAIGTQSRGLTQEQIASLPVTKYKSRLFSRKKAQER